jgi:hypothetical protein
VGYLRWGKKEVLSGSVTGIKGDGPEIVRCYAYLKIQSSENIKEVNGKKLMFSIWSCESLRIRKGGNDK